MDVEFAESIAKALDTLERETIERCAMVADEDKGTLATRVAQRIRNLVRGE